jgi:tetratricopeptide (TPR) repeat protein
MDQNSFLKVVFLFIFSTTNVVAQNKSVDLKAVWENATNSDSVRFKALADYYIINNQAQPDSSLKALNYYYQLAKEKNNIKELYNVANDRGNIYGLFYESDSALNYYYEAQKLAEKLNEPALKAAILGNIGNVYANKKDYSKALQYFSNSINTFKRIKDIKGESHMLTNMGSVYLYIQNFDLALEYYQKALSMIKDIEVPQNRKALIYLNIGWTNYELKKFKEAKVNYEKALEILEISNDKFFLVSCYFTLAKIHLECNELEKASEYAEKNMILSKELKMNGFIKEGQVVLAQLALKKGNIAEAKKIGLSILELKQSSSFELKRSLYNLLYKVYQAENNSEKSLEMYQKYNIYKDSIQLQRNELSLIREVIKNEFDDVVVKNEQILLKERAALESKQQKKTYGIILASIILIALIVFSFTRNLKKNREKREQLLQEIENLKRKVANQLPVNPKIESLKPIDADNPVENLEIEQLKPIEDDNLVLNSETEQLKPDQFNNLAVNSNEFQLVREKIEATINRKLNATDWSVLNILLKEPDISNKEIAEKTFMSVDGIGSSLRRMYTYFDLKESKYKKISLVMEAIKASS